MRQFGQSYKVRDNGSRVARDKSGQTFIYEGKREKSSFIRKGKRDDTRSLYDDPKLQQLRQNNMTRKMVKSLSSEVGVGCSWVPLLSEQQIPEQYYMSDKFQGDYGAINMDSSVVQSEYDVFKLFFNDEIYDLIIRNSRERYEEKYIE